MTAKEVMSDSNSHEIKATKVSKPAKGSTIGRQKKNQRYNFCKKSASYVHLSLKLDYHPSMEWARPQANFLQITQCIAMAGPLINPTRNPTTNSKLQVQPGLFSKFKNWYKNSSLHEYNNQKLALKNELKNDTCLSGCPFVLILVLCSTL